MNVVFSILLSLSLFSAIAQSGYQPTGELRELQIFTVDVSTADNFPLVTLEVLADGDRIAATRTDFDGFASLTICSKKFNGDSIDIRTQAVGCSSQLHRVRLTGNTSVTLRLKTDPTHGLTFEELEEYNYAIIEPCRPDFFEQEYGQNHTYIHCDGRLLHFRQIVDGNENLDEWERLK